MDPRVISLDIESSGLLKHGKQTTYHPAKILHLDGGTLADLCISICLTIPKEDPRTWPTPPVVTNRWAASSTARYNPQPTGSPATPSDASSTTTTSASGCLTTSSTEPSTATATTSSSRTTTAKTPLSTSFSSEPVPAAPPAYWHLWHLAGLEPGATMHLDPTNPRHLSILARWLGHCDTLIGQNLKYDLLMLRAYSPLLRRLLCGNHLIIDLSAVNFLHSENRPERSLKTLGPILGTHIYADDVLATYKNQSAKYDTATDPKLIDHNAQDTHNTLLSIRELSRRIIRDYGVTAKCSPFSLRFFSETVWTCLFMEESGLCFSRTRLQELEDRCLHRSASIARVLKPYVELTPGSKDIKKSQAAFLETCLSTIESTTGGVDIRSHPSLSLTEKARDISFNEENFNLFRLYLPPRHPLHRACRLIVAQKYAEKLVSTYTYPLLRGTRPSRGPGKKRITREQVAIPCNHNPLLGISYPSWFITPGSIKDDSGSTGGTKQGRITCKGPALQTFPPPIKSCQHSRSPGGLRVGDDLSQIELRIAALLSGEPSMCSEYAKELKGEKPDLHRQMAVSIFGLEVLKNPHWKDGTHDDPRQWGGKTPNFLILYRGGPDKYQETVLRDSGRLLDMPLCHRVVTGARAARPVLWAWQDSLIADARRYGYLSLPLTGHTRTFITGRGAKFDENEICNFKVQTVAGLVQLAYQHTLTHLLAPFTREGGPIALMESNVYDAVYFDLRNKTDLPLLKELCHAAIKHQETQGYWAALCSHLGRFVPLNHELKVLTLGDDPSSGT